MHRRPSAQEFENGAKRELRLLTDLESSSRHLAVALTTERLPPFEPDASAFRLMA